VDRNDPPAELIFRYVTTDRVQPGQWFIAPSAGTIYQWNFNEPSKNRHPVYELTVVAKGTT
jgi:hypothetical protein